MTNIEYIDSYFNKELSAGERAGFDKKIADDPGFAEEVLFYCGALQLAKELSMEEKKDRFRELYAQKQQPAKVRTLHRWWTYAAAAAVIVTMVVFGMRYFNSESLEQKADQFISQHLTTVGIEMGSADEMQKAKELFNQNKLEESLVLLNRILAAGQGGDEARKLAGIVTLRLEKYDQAIDHFTNLEKSPSYTNPGKFYHALTLIKRNMAGDKDKAKLLLQQVVNENLEEKETAAKWLKDL
jgi:hypothetical protein